MQRIGFVGAGLMGHGAAKHIMAKGWPLTVLAHRNRAPIDDLVSRGASEAKSVAELTINSDIVFLCLPDTPTVDAVLHAERGVLAGAHPDLIVLDMTTSLPEATRRFAAELAEHGARMLDAPMTRTPIEAEEGRINVLLGGDEETVAKVRPVVESFCENVWHVGPLGAAHTFKLVHNFVAICTMAVSIEAGVAARRLGIDMAQFYDIATQGGADSVMFRKVAAYSARGDGAGLQAHASTALKDLRYFNSLADDAGLHVTMPKAAQQLFQLACTMGHADTHIPALYDLFAGINEPK
jgi:3-hydroxyisobutyrate dehydrogenase-like beta-hydroxyacid dehydrogenase